MFMRNRLARKMAAEMREATCAGTQTSKAPTLSGPSVTNHYSVGRTQRRLDKQLANCHVRSRPIRSLHFLIVFSNKFDQENLHSTRNK